MTFFLFLFGAAIGSFLNVVSFRYNPEKFILSQKIIGGRSYCPHCKKTLRWFELVPLASFLVQRGRCRNCAARLNFQYPIVEILSGLIFVLVPLRLSAYELTSLRAYELIAPWILVFLSLLLLSLIDFRLSLIPDEANIFLAILGIAMIFLSPRASALTSSLGGALFAFIIFGAIILLTRGRGMGLGDLKLAAPLGLLFGWPDIALVTVLSFVIGAVFGAGLMIFRHKKLKSTIPFGPFLAIAAAVTFFFGHELVSFYFHLFAL